jgi:3alpha(or 20beta)-hydroxysteroid dehydrogenase
MTKSAAQELSPHGIRVNSIHPGIIETAMVDEFSRKGINERVRDQIPMGHYADASEVANLALFLASDESTYCSGSEFVVDGGVTA